MVWLGVLFFGCRRCALWSLVVLGVAATESICGAQTKAPTSGPISSSLIPKSSAAVSRVEALLAQTGVSRGPGGSRLAQATNPGTNGTRELIIHWSAPRAALVSDASASGSPEPQPFSLDSQNTWPEPVVRQRAPELAEHQLLYAAVDTQDRLVYWGIIADPRFVRVESPVASGSGELAGDEIQLDSVSFPVLLPGDPTVLAVRFFGPDWNGQEFSLEALGTCAIP